MQRQLELWPAAQSAPRPSQIWQRLAPEEQAALIAALARLIRRAAVPEKSRQIQEKSHEP